MKREIEISAAMNARGYRISLKINGREFSAYSKSGGELSDITMKIGNQIEQVYGAELKTKYWKYKDIHAAMSATTRIASHLRILCLRLNGGEDFV